MKMKQKILSAAVLAAMGSGVQATVDLDANPVQPVVIGSEVDTPATITRTATGNELSIKAELPVPYDASASNSLIVRFIINNGAQFASTGVQLSCSATGGAVTAVSPIAGLGTNELSFEVTGTEVGGVDDAGLISACTLTAVTGITGVAGDVDVTVTFVDKNKVVLSTGTQSGPYIQFKKGVSAFVSTANQWVAQVASGFTKVNSGNNSISQNVHLGTVTYQSNSSAQIHTQTAAISATDVINSAAVTLTGDPLQAASTAFVVSAGQTCTAGTKLASQAVSGATVTVSGITAQAMDAGVKVCVNFDGATPIPAGNVTVTLTCDAKSGFTPDCGIPNNPLAVFTRNGATSVAYNVPNPSAPDSVFIRVYNTSGQDGKVRVTLYAEDGTVIGTANTLLIDPLKSNEVQVFTVDDLLTAVGAPTTPPSGRYRAVFTGEVPAGRLHVQNLVRQASGGPLTNMSPTGTENF